MSDNRVEQMTVAPTPSTGPISDVIRANVSAGVHAGSAPTRPTEGDTFQYGNNEFVVVSTTGSGRVYPGTEVFVRAEPEEPAEGGLAPEQANRSGGGGHTPPAFRDGDDYFATKATLVSGTGGRDLKFRGFSPGQHGAKVLVHAMPLDEVDPDQVPDRSRMETFKTMLRGGQERRVGQEPYRAEVSTGKLTDVALGERLLLYLVPNPGNPFY